MSDIEYWDPHTGEGLTDRELHERFDDMLDEYFEGYPFGQMTFLPSSILKGCDPIAYRCSFVDWLDSELQDGALLDEDPSVEGAEGREE